MDPLLKKILWFGAAYLVVAGAAIAYFVATGALVRQGGLDEAMVARGAALYAEHCARCHGRALDGQPGWETRRANGTIPAPPLDASGHAWQHADRALFDMIKLGGALFARRGEMSEMPAFREALSDAEVWAAIAYIKSRWPEEIRAAQLRSNLIGGFEHH